ncbi:protein hemingway isoform X2 [Drosophila suzukii]|uniref:Protein hemingway isoform X2 n=1 Tax=Drosophila suzukii TaxID=28584 RepID=A0AB40AFE9_DROSZ
MSEAGENSDEEYYAEESFEEDSQSEVEEQEEEEVEEVEDEEDENVELEKPNQNGALLLDESDTQSESDAEAEFIRGNPHARRQMAGRSSSGFNRDRMVSYPSSSSEDESQVVITKTVAEVNQLSLRLDTPLEDDAPSVRTLVPGSAHSRTKDEVVDDDEDAEVEEVEEVEEEEEIQSGDDDAQSDGTMESNDGRQSGEETDEDEDEGTDVEVEQLEEDEPIVTALCREKVQKMPLPLQEDIVSLVDASDNSSEHSVATMCMAGDETDVTLEESPRFQKQQPGREAVIEEEPEEDVLEDHLNNLSELLNNESPSPTQQPDLARVRYLEQQMTQMSEIIMKSFQINGGTPNSQAFEQLAMAKDLMQRRSLRLEETESEMASMTESAMTSARSLGGGRPPIRMRMQRSQEALITTRPSKLIRPKCRCPLESELLDQEQEMQMDQQLAQKLGQDLEPNLGMGMGLDEDYLVDECGQGDGLMRHPQQRRPAEFKRRAASGTPSSFNSDGCEYPINVSRSRCSNDKVNYKNLGRKSFSFTNPQVREIERQNQILLRKMMTVKPTATIKASTSSLKIGGPEKRQPPPAARLSSAAVNRKKFQRQIDLDNDLLKRKLEAIGTRRPQFK